MTKTPFSKKKYFLALLCICYSFALLRAQDLHVYYNAQTEATTYLYKGDTLTNPQVKKAGTIFVHVEELNNYLYKIELDVSREDIVSSTASSNPLKDILRSSIQSLVLPSYSGSGSYPSTSDYPYDTGINQLDNTTIDLPSGFAGNSKEAELASLKTTLLQHLISLEGIEKKIQSHFEKITTIVERDKVRQIAIVDVENLKYHPTIPPSRLKTLTKEYVDKIFGKPIQEVSLDDLLLVSKPQAEIASNLQLLHQDIAQYQTGLQSLDSIQLSLSSLVMDAEEYQTIKTIATDFTQKANDYAGRVQENLTQIAQVAPIQEENSFQALSTFRLSAEEIMLNDFSQTFSVPVNSDRTSISIKTLIKDSLNINGNRTAAINTKPINVPSTGDLKISASVGLGFSQFFETPKEYFTKNRIITSAETNSFAPSVVSFIHFYPQRQQGFTLGGSFGVGIPIGASNGQSTSFFLGASSIFGRSERIVLTAGVMTGKVNQLGNGFREGEAFDTSFGVPLPVSSTYELGLFVGFSFSFL